MSRNSRTGSARVRMFGRIAVAAFVIAAPVGAAGVAAATPEMAARAVEGPGIVQADYGDWYHWHCDVMHEWWRPRCHPQFPQQPMPQTGSS